MAFAGLIPQEHRGRGLTACELDRAQEEAGAPFPEDPHELLRECLPTGPFFPDWRGDPAGAMARWRETLLNGILFDVSDGFWRRDWGERPAASEARSAVIELLRGAPDLIPIYLHRAIPNDPLVPGNPVFSIAQTDAIFYGVDLEDYLHNEFQRRSPEIKRPDREIRFWTSFVLNQ